MHRVCRITTRKTSLGARAPCLAVRSYAKEATQAARIPKREATIADVFANPDEEGPPLPQRFSDLKKRMCADKDAMVHAWRGVLKELEIATEEIERRGNDVRDSISLDRLLG